MATTDTWAWYNGDTWPGFSATNQNNMGSDDNGLNISGLSLTEITYDDADNNGRIYDGDTDDLTSPAETIIVNGVTKTLHEASNYSNSTITLTDGSTISVRLNTWLFTDGTYLVRIGDNQMSGFPFADIDYSVPFVLGSGGGDGAWVTPSLNDDTLPPGITIPCFTAGTLIKMQYGHLEVQKICVGCEIPTKDNGLQTVRWVGHRKLSGDVLKQKPNLLPIRIEAGALGKNLPAKTLMVSPQHRILVSSEIVLRMFGSHEVLIAAKDLVVMEGIDIAHDITEVVYVHILFDNHEIICSDGAWTESLYAGKQALVSVGAEAKGEIFELFPQLADPLFVVPPAKPIVRGVRGRKMISRHIKNNQVFCDLDKFMDGHEYAAQSSYEHTYSTA